MAPCTALSCTAPDDSAPTTSVSELGVWSHISPSPCDCGVYPPSDCGKVYNNSTNSNALRVGCVFMAKKMESMQSIINPRTKDKHCAVEESATAAPMHGGEVDVEDRPVVFQTIQLEDVPVEAQGEFDVILHKLSEDVTNRCVF